MVRTVRVTHGERTGRIHYSIGAAGTAGCQLENSVGTRWIRCLI